MKIRFVASADWLARALSVARGVDAQRVPRSARWAGFPWLGVLAFSAAIGWAAPVFPAGSAGKPQASALSSWYLRVTRVVWTSATGSADATSLVGEKPGQALLKNAQPPCVLEPAVNGADGFRHERKADGSVKPQIDAPAGVVVVRE